MAGTLFRSMLATPKPMQHSGRWGRLVPGFWGHCTRADLNLISWYRTAHACIIPAASRCSSRSPHQRTDRRSLRVVLQAFQQEREAQRDPEINDFYASSRLFKLGRDVVPNRTRTVIFRQLVYENPRVGKRGKRRHSRDDDFGARGATNRLQLHDAFSHACMSAAFIPSP
jgi:hypothetical protein